MFTLSFSAWIGKLFRRMEQTPLLSGIRGGLITAMPMLLIGSFALIFRTFLTGLSLDGPMIQGALMVSNFVYDATFGIMSLYLTDFISLSYLRQKNDQTDPFGAAVCALVGLVILSGGLTTGFENGGFGVLGMFTAIVSAVVAVRLYLFFSTARPRPPLAARGAAPAFVAALNSIFPLALTTLCFAFFNLAITHLFSANSFQELFIQTTNGLFANMGRSFGSSALFVELSSLLWFFGVHGSDVLEHVAETIFVPGIAHNAALLQQGAAPTEIFSKVFLDSFVMMGGCGALMALLAAILLFGRSKGSRALAKRAALPMLFNVNEIMVFGLPVVLNPVFFIPFLLTPLVNLIISSAAMAMGLVPLVSHTVEWTTPILVSGYIATGSIAGVLLQLFNLCIDIALYRPFVSVYDHMQTEGARTRLDQLVAQLRRSEESGDHLSLTQQTSDLGAVARQLTADLRACLERGEWELYYQPQYDAAGQMRGAEALLRWEHPDYGFLDPPLIIRLAEEGGFLEQLEQGVFLRALEEGNDLAAHTAAPFKISVNLTPKSLQSPTCLDFLRQLSQREAFVPGRFYIEVTEQFALRLDDEMQLKLDQLHKMGFLLAIDDFAMGSTSLRYLQHRGFDLVKLDGSLVRELEMNPRSREIVLSIVELSRSLHCQVLAEYVETESCRLLLEECGCTLYQGYLFGPPMPPKTLIEKHLTAPLGDAK